MTYSREVGLCRQGRKVRVWGGALVNFFLLLGKESKHFNALSLNYLKLLIDITDIISKTYFRGCGCAERQESQNGVLAFWGRNSKHFKTLF